MGIKREGKTLTRFRTPFIGLFLLFIVICLASCSPGESTVSNSSPTIPGSQKVRNSAIEESSGTGAEGEEDDGLIEKHTILETTYDTNDRAARPAEEKVPYVDYVTINNVPVDLASLTSLEDDEDVQVSSQEKTCSFFVRTKEIDKANYLVIDKDYLTSWKKQEENMGAAYQGPRASDLSSYFISAVSGESIGECLYALGAQPSQENMEGSELKMYLRKEGDRKKIDLASCFPEAENLHFVFNEEYTLHCFAPLCLLNKDLIESRAFLYDSIITYSTAQNTPWPLPDFSKLSLQPDERYVLEIQILD